MPFAPTAQGFTVTFGGATIGKIQRFRVSFPGGQSIDVTSTGATILGSGSNSRVVRQIDFTSVDPVALEVEFFGTNSIGPTDRGRRATLVVSGAGVSLSGTAFLTSCEIAGAAKDRVRGIAQFTMDT